MLGCDMVVAAGGEARACLKPGDGHAIVNSNEAPTGDFTRDPDLAFPGADLQKLIAIAAVGLNRIDPITYAPHVLEDPYPWAPAGRQVLLQAGIGDTQVPILSAHLLARTLGLLQLEPASRPIPSIFWAWINWSWSAASCWARSVSEA